MDHASLDLTVGSDLRSLMGFTIGASLQSQRCAFDQLAALGFAQSDPTKEPNDGQGWRVLWQRMNDASNKNEFDYAVSFEFAPDRKLIQLGVLIGKLMQGQQANERVRAARSLRDYLVLQAGTPRLYMDRIDAWSVDSPDDLSIETAYAAIWLPSEVAGGMVQCVADIDSLIAVCRAFSANGMVASISASQNGVVATLDLVQFPTTDRSAHSVVSKFFAMSEN